MARLILKENVGMSLPDTVDGNDVRRLTAEEDDTLDINDSSTGVRTIIYTIPILDLEKNLGPEAKTVLINAGGISRTFRRAELEMTHLLFALVEDPGITQILEDLNISQQKLINVMKAEISEGNFADYELRRIDIQLAKEVEYLLKNSLDFSGENKSSMIKPVHILMTLLRSDYPEISDILRAAGIDIVSLAEGIENASHTSK